MRYGYWMPVFGGWLRNVENEGMEASWDYVKKLARRSVTPSKKRQPLSAEALCGLPEPLFVVSKCHGRVIETQPSLTAAKRVLLTAPASAVIWPVAGSVATRCGFRN